MLGASVYGLLNFQRIKGASKWIVYQMTVTTLCETYATFYSLWTLKKVAFPIYHFLNPIEYLLFALFFCELTEKTSTKRFILATVTVLLLISLSNTLWVQPLNTDNSNAYLAGGALMVMYSLLYYIELYQRENFSVPIIKLPDFWIVTGVFFLYAGSFFVIGFTRIIVAVEPAIAPKLYIINVILNILLNVLVFYGFRCATRVET